ncbi:unnamed protein product [Linum trigynum]|uniref:F-box protein At3g26010-like beta-propeller domain-containing protein n=1 Tax=Linum trigynum TaxID=586398 RepID=A0AAV2DSP5_9ROSI
MATETCTAVSDRFRVGRKRRSLPEVNTPSPMMISELGDDLLIEVLIRSFPDPRSACRSKAVCKQWRSLISDPCFRRRFLSHHQSKSKPPPPMLLLSPASLLTFLPMPARPPEHFAVLDCFKDLLLCGFGEVFYRRTNPQLARSYLLCNPFTEQWIALPLAPERPLELTGFCARLVCEPLVSNSLDVGFGHEYRFRVVCVYQVGNSMKLDVFCSESGQWVKHAIVLDGYRRCGRNNVVSCSNGVLYLSYARAQDLDAGLYRPLIAGFDPFRFDKPPTLIDVSPISSKKHWSISVSQGALHLSVYEHQKPMVLSVWRLRDDCKLWRKVCESALKSSSGDNYELLFLGVPSLHPEMPEIAFFTNLPGSVGSPGHCHVFCDLGSGGELEFISVATQYFDRWRVFQPKIYCWPTRIPRYQKLRGLYDGNYSCWVQINEPLTPSITEERQSVDGVEAGRQKKLKVAKGLHLRSSTMKGNGFTRE